MRAKAYDKKTAAFAGFIIQNMPDGLTDEIMDGWMDNPTATKRLLAGFVPPPEPAAEPVPQPLDTIIRVDRLVRPTYPDWADTDFVNAPEFIALEQAGPAEYDLSTKVEQWLHEGQKGSGWVHGQVIYDHLVASNELANHLALADGLAIQAKGIAVFRKFFVGKAVFLWRLAVRSHDGHWSVPYLYERGGQVYLNWNWLDYKWHGSPALRFAK